MPDITEPTEIPLRNQVAEAMFDEWCQQNGSDTGWGSSEVDEKIRILWLVLADFAIAAIEYDHMIVERR